MTQVEVYFHAFYILHNQRFVIQVQVTRYQERIQILENIRAFNGEFVGGCVNETIICPPQSDILDED